MEEKRDKKARKKEERIKRKEEEKREKEVGMVWNYSYIVNNLGNPWNTYIVVCSILVLQMWNHKPALWEAS